jgi:hypothetical protein
VNVHTGARYDLVWDENDMRYEADVQPGTYQIFASAEGYAPQMEPKVVYMLDSENDDNVQQIRLNIIGTDAMVRVHVTYNGEDLEGAKVHLFGDNGIHLSKGTTPMGYANISAPDGEDLHLVVMAKGKVTYSAEVTPSGTTDVPVAMVAKPAKPENSYMVIGLVMNGSVNIPGIDVMVWDVNYGHFVPVAGDFEGAVSLPLYDSTFHVVMEADGYEPLLEQSIDLETNTYYMPPGEAFEMTKIKTKESKVTTVNLASDIQNPFISTVWTLDGNSRIYGTMNDFGSPRMQVAGSPFTTDWFTVDGTEVNDTRSMIKNFGPAWAMTEEFLKVNNEYYTADDQSYMVEVTDLAGDSLEDGVNPEITMTSAYTSDLDVNLKKDDIRVEIFSVLEGEVIDVILPANYEILGNFGEKAEFIDDNTSKLRVFEPLEFNAKIEEAPEAALRFVNSFDFYRVEPKKYIVGLDENITLSASGSSDIVGTIEHYMWNGLPDNIQVWDDEEEVFVAKDEMDLTEMDEITFQFTAHKDGYHNITLQVKDSSMMMSEKDWIEIMPDGMAPTITDYTMIFKDSGDNVTMEGEKYVADEDTIIVFNASSASDGNGEIVDWVWTFGDDTGSLNGEVVEHAFMDFGEFNVTLRVVDAVGNEIELLNSSTYMVNDITKPFAVIKSFLDYKQGDSVEMNGSQSYDPTTNEQMKDAIVSYTWYMRSQGDNVTDQEEFGNEEVFEYIFEEPGNYVINLTVEDESGLIGWVEKVLPISGPDLQVNSIDFKNKGLNDLKENEKTTIIIAFTNAGTVEINKTWRLKIEFDGKEIKTDEVSGTLEPGEIGYYNYTYKLNKKDEKLFRVILDIDGDIAEMNEETNNELETEVSIDPDDPIFQWWMVLIVVAIILVGYVVYMKYTRGEWGYEPIQRWWENRNS